MEMLFGADTGQTISEPALPVRSEGVKVEVFKDGRCRVHVWATRSTLLISIHKDQGDSDSARLGEDLDIDNPVTFFEVKHSDQPEQALTYREPDDFIAWELEPFYGRIDTRYVGKGWRFDQEHDQIVRMAPTVYDSPGNRIITYDIHDVFSDRSLVPSYENEITSEAFAWRDEQLSSFRTQMQLDIPSSCDDARRHISAHQDARRRKVVRAYPAGDN